MYSISVLTLFCILQNRIHAEPTLISKINPDGPVTLAKIQELIWKDFPIQENIKDLEYNELAKKEVEKRLETRSDPAVAQSPESLVCTKPVQVKLVNYFLTLPDVNKPVVKIFAKLASQIRENRELVVNFARVELKNRKVLGFHVDGLLEREKENEFKIVAGVVLEAMTAQTFFEMIKNTSKSDLDDDLKRLSERPNGTTCISYRANRDKNRIGEPDCSDAGRVILKTSNEGEPETDYIHANYIDGYNRQQAYIATQGPIDSTVYNFWRMIWQENTTTIVMLTKLASTHVLNGDFVEIENSVLYWPEAKGDVKEVMRHFRIENVEVKEEGCYRVSSFEIKNMLESSAQTRFVKHFWFTRWPNGGIPVLTELISLIDGVRECQKGWRGNLGSEVQPNAKEPPVVVHCRAGVHRTGTFITIDITFEQLAAVGTVDVIGVIKHIRETRVESVFGDQYPFCIVAALEYAAQKGMIKEDVRPTQEIILPSDDWKIFQEELIVTQKFTVMETGQPSGLVDPSKIVQAQDAVVVLPPTEPVVQEQSLIYQQPSESSDGIPRKSDGGPLKKEPADNVEPKSCFGCLHFGRRKKNVTPKTVL